jgi:hypothetical protein
MSHRLRRWKWAGLAAIATLPLVSIWAAEQANARRSDATRPTANRPAAPRTADGRPDLSGVWSYATATPLQRPKELAGKAVLTDEEAAAYVKTLADGGCRIIKCDGSAQATLETAYNDFWWDWGNALALNRTSLIVDPPDGQMPALTPQAREKMAAARARRGPRGAGPEDQSLSDRCVMGFNSGPPLSPSAYNNNVQVFQTPDHVVLLSEMIHNARIVPLDGRPHVSKGTRQWAGDSRGRWDGDTLVIETTNFRSETAPGGGDPTTARLVERLSRLDADTLMYEYTMNDPAVWTRPWTVQIPMKKNPQPIYEYACHEGNYAMANMLSAARAEEKSTSGTSK